MYVHNLYMFIIKFFHNVLKYFTIFIEFFIWPEHISSGVRVHLAAAKKQVSTQKYKTQS